jgi:hypothetical protein
MAYQKLQITPAVYRCVKSLLTAICTFGVEAYAPIRTLPELELYFAQEALQHSAMREQLGAHSTNAKQELLKSVTEFKAEYEAAMERAKVKQAFCNAIEWADGLQFGGTAGWPARVNEAQPTVAAALAMATQTAAEYHSLYETLMFLTSLVPNGLKSQEADIVRNDLNQRHAQVRVRLLQFQILTATPDSLPRLQQSLKAEFREPYSIMQHLNFGATVPSGWPSLMEKQFRENLLAA